MDNRMDQLWKDFGRETEAGKLLFSLYKVRNKPEVYYPPVKTKKKPLPFEETRSRTVDKPQIDYPAPNRPRHRKFHPIDFVPHKKNQQAIKDDVSKLPRDTQMRPQRAVNREAMKNDLQDKFQFAEGKSLPGGGVPPTKPVLPRRQEAQKQDISKNPDDLFDMIVQEIEERQKFLNELHDMGQLTHEIEHRVKGEIAERLGDLQKLRQLSS